MDVKAERDGFWTGFLIGSLIGAGAGLLLAPVPGVETRARIKDALGQAGTTASQLTSGTKQSVSSATGHSREYIEGFRARLSRSIAAAREAAAAKRAQLEAQVEAVTEPKPSM